MYAVWHNRGLSEVCPKLAGPKKCSRRGESLGLRQPRNLRDSTYRREPPAGLGDEQETASAQLICSGVAGREAHWAAGAPKQQAKRLREWTKERCSDSEPPGYCSGQRLAAHTQYLTGAGGKCHTVAGVEDDDDNNNRGPSRAAGSDGIKEKLDGPLFRAAGRPRSDVERVHAREEQRSRGEEPGRGTQRCQPHQRPGVVQSSVERRCNLSPPSHAPTTVERPHPRRRRALSRPPAALSQISRRPRKNPSHYRSPAAVASRYLSFDGKHCALHHRLAQQRQAEGARGRRPPCVGNEGHRQQVRRGVARAASGRHGRRVWSSFPARRAWRRLGHGASQYQSPMWDGSRRTGARRDAISLRSGSAENRASLCTVLLRPSAARQLRESSLCRTSGRFLSMVASHGLTSCVGFTVAAHVEDPGSRPSANTEDLSHASDDHRQSNEKIRITTRWEASSTSTRSCGYRGHQGAPSFALWRKDPGILWQGQGSFSSRFDRAAMAKRHPRPTGPTRASTPSFSDIRFATQSGDTSRHGSGGTDRARNNGITAVPASTCVEKNPRPHLPDSKRWKALPAA